MRRNWQLPDWPEFRFDADRIRAAEEQFLKGSGVIIGALHHLDADARDGLTVELISQEVVDSSAIEGEILDRDSVQSSLAKHFGFATDSRCATAAEAGAAELMADVYRNHAAPLDDQTLFAWHAMLMNGRRDITDVGRYRTNEDAMQIVSGALLAPPVHFEAPPSDTVPMEMSRTIAWFNNSAPSSPNPLLWHKVVLPHARITPLRLHDLRHNFASHAAIEKENAAMIGKMLGHSGTDNVQRYMHLADQPALDAAELVSSVLWDSLVNGTSTAAPATAKIRAVGCQIAR